MPPYLKLAEILSGTEIKGSREAFISMAEHSGWGHWSRQMVFAATSPSIQNVCLFLPLTTWHPNSSFRLILRNARPQVARQVNPHLSRDNWKACTASICLVLIP